MKIVEFLAQLRDLGIQLWAEDGRLRYRAPEGVLTAALRAELVARKAEVLAFLAQVAGDTAASAPPIRSVLRTEPLPLSFAQERLWFIDQWEPGRATYNLPQTVRLRGSLDIDALRASLSAVVRRHEVLRTSFGDGSATDTAGSGHAVQIIHPPAAVALPYHDLRGLPQSERAEAARQLAAAEAGRPFDLVHDSLLRALLIGISDTDHLLVLTVHHIVSDGWSLGLMIRELTAYYTANMHGAAAVDPFPPLPVQYADYAVWQRQWLKGDVLDRELAYWRGQLSGAPALLELPTDRPRPARQTFNGAIETALIPAELVAQVAALSQREGATLFMSLLAAFQTLLHRYTAQHDLVIGSPVSGRSHAEIEGLIGCFVNMLALRIDLSGNPSFSALLQRVREMTVEAYAHQEVPFEKVVEAVQPARTLSHAPIFQVVFMLEYAATGSYQLPELELSPVALDHTVAKFDLELALTESSDGLWAAVEYNTDLFDRATIARLLGHYRTLLEHIVADPSTRIGELPLLTGDELQQLRVWQGAQASYPVSDSLHTRFESHAARTPAAVAVVYEDQRLSYAELNARANQLAHELRARGVGPETGVALYLDRSPDLVVAVLAILKAGGAYVPLDPAYPPERVALIMADAQVPVLLTHAALHDRLPPHSAAAICLDRDWPTIARQPVDNVPSASDPAQLAYVIYTSGSTGRPKGVLVSHAEALRLFAATDEWFHFGADDVWTLFHSIAFDFSVWELWGALLYGGRLVVVPYLTSRAPDAFYRLLREERVTVLNQTPSAFRQLIHAEAELEESPDALALRLVIFGGEALELPSLRPWFACHGDQRPQLVNMYGITETTVHVTYRPLSSDDLAGAAPSVIGGPIPDLQLYVLDPFGQPVPAGISGELYVGGAGVARGYLGLPALTAERFVPDPWSDRPGARLYRSGDLARWLPNGDVQYLGRIDHQVKIRGFRIELGEIEAVLQQHPAIREVLVLARDASPTTSDAPASAHADKRLVAYLVGNVAPEPSVEELRRFIKLHLPEYMVPSAFVWLPAFPLTPNGKIDRKALPGPAQARPALAKDFEPPRTPAEETLAGVWADVLGVERIGIHDNFFSLGGDSIRSLQVIAAARTRGLDLTLHQMFEHQTIAALAETLNGATAAPLPSARPPFAQISDADRELLPPDVEDAYPLATLQSGMLFHSAASSEAALYQDRFSFYLRAPYDPAALRAVLHTISVRHATLRTSFELSRFSVPLQLVHRSVAIPLELHDLRDLDVTAQEAALDEWMAHDQRQAFDWTCAPLLRLALHRRTDDTFQLTIGCHHALLDGWSVALLVGELLQLYRAALGRSVPALPPAGPSYGDFIALEQQSLADPSQLAYWLAQMDGSTPTSVPRWGAPQAEQAVTSVAIDCPPAVADGLRRLAQSADVPLKSVLLAAHLRALSQLSGQTDLVTGLVVNGRPETEHSERTLGLFLNTIPLRMRLTGGSWLDLVRAAFAAERATLPYRRYPLARLQQQLGGQTLFETAFNFVHFHVLQSLADVDDMEGLGGSAFARTNFPLAANFTQDPTTGVLDLVLDYDPTLMQPAQVEAYSGYYARALAAMAADPDARYETADLLAASERQQLLRTWNATSTPYPQDRCAHELFAEQAERTPDAVAVVFVDTDGATRQLSYAELNGRADQLARYLRQSDDRRTSGERLIGLYLERSPEVIVAILGVLKAGAAYVPLDPTYPAERLRFMMADADVSLVLTQQHLTQRLATIAPGHAEMLCLDVDWPAIEAAKPDAVAIVRPEQLAYVIYTSGSTGRPKGVLVSHRGIGNLAQAQIAAFAVQPSSHVLQFAALSFDAAVAEMWMALLAGAALYLAPREALLPGPGLLDLLRTHAIDVLTLPPSALAALPQHDQARTLPALRTLAVAGEACPPELIARWGHGRRFLNAYGPTETTVCATIAECADGSQRPPIGRPIANTEVYVLDDRLQPVPIGTPGELYIGGVGLARGYHHRPDLTAERFVPHPFGTLPGARLYRSGDLARWLPDGSLDYLGRRDEQIKLRGFRIEPGEIEAVLAQHPAVRQCAVVVSDAAPQSEQADDDTSHRRLVAYVVPQLDGEQQLPSAVDTTDGATGLALDLAELRSFVQERLPAYMIPAAFVLLPALPLSPSGKIDRKTLAQRAATLEALPPSDADTLEPRDRWELAVARLWQDLLQTGPVGMDDDFFKRGGDSLLAVRLVARIEQEFGRQVSVAALINAPTVAEVAALLRQQPADQGWSPLVPIQPGSARPPLFCVHPIGGHVLSYVKLAQQIGRDQPFYGLQARGLEDDQTPPETIAELAADYLAAIRQIQPHGPYFLSGWSFGGVVALEMAQQVLQQGEEVALLVVIDSALDPPIKAASSPAEETLHLASGLGGAFGKDLGITADDLTGLDQAEQLDFLLQRGRSLGVVPSDLGPTQLNRYLAVFRASTRAAHSYEPQRYPLPIVMIHAEEADPDDRLAREGDWQAIAGGGLATEIVPGNHYTMMRTPEQMARRIRAELDRVLADADSMTEAHAST